MLPNTGDILGQDFVISSAPSMVPRMDGGRLNGYADGLEAVEQAIYSILNTERYEWAIYSWNYGVELKGLFGKPMGLVKSKLKKRIREALMQDDRIQGVDGFSFAVSGRKLHASFTAHTRYGDVGAGKEVEV